jgi:hypothetical protein
MLRRFATWFSSAAGVWQTVAVCMGWVAFERIFRHADPSGFVLLYVMTVYSAVTQPVLAYANRQDTEATDLVLKKLQDVLDQLATMEATIAEDVEDIEEALSLEKEVKHDV